VSSSLSDPQVKVFRYWILLLHIVLISAASFSSDSIITDDYSFNMNEFEKKPFDTFASIEFYPSLLFYNRTSPLYSLMFKSEEQTHAENYNLKTEAYLQYQSKQFLTFVSGSLYGSYLDQDNTLDSDGKLFEGYMKYSPDDSLSFLLGKRLFQWGKGYSYNPVSFAGRLKDLNNIDAALEGYWNMSLEYIKSLDSTTISTIAFNTALLPVYDSINKDYLPDKSVAWLTQLYMLILNTDIDIYFLTDSRNNLKTGLDFSRNLTSNLEIHGEWAYIKDHNTTVFSDETNMINYSHPANNIVTGIRYLDSLNTTFILEYLHVGSGYSQREINEYWNAVNFADTSSDPQRIQSVLQAYSRYYNSQFINTDYVFIKASHPDPFNFVYFTPSIYMIVNTLDHSKMTGFEMTYSRSRNLLFTGRYIVFSGNNKSEYGSKPVQHRIEFRTKWSF